MTWSGDPHDRVTGDARQDRDRPRPGWCIVRHHAAGLLRAARTLGAVSAMLGVSAVLNAQADGHGAAPDDVSGLPIRAIPSASASPAALAVMLTGDGGWAALDKRVGAYLAGHGLGVVGLDSREYLMRRRSPEETARDLARIIRHFEAAWRVARVALIGYSRGADIAPFAANRLPADLRQQIGVIALLGPGERASFQFHWLDLVRDAVRPSDPPVLPELERLRGTPVLCVYGADEEESLCRLADTSSVRVDRRPGRHHFDGDYEAIAAEILGTIAPANAGGQ